MLQREGQFRNISGCAISGIINKKGKKFSGETIIKSIAPMHDRSNGLGGGFAAYGIYPEYKELYAFHVFYDTIDAKNKTEEYLNRHFIIELAGRIPTRKTENIKKSPIIWRYFARPNPIKLMESELDEDEFTAQCVIKVNRFYDGAYIFSSGKNMGAFKAVGYPEEVGEFYRLEDYKGYCWTAHGRFPTNTPGWWGGAHPFTILDWSIVHNGEISSYDANRRYIEMFGYSCTLQTDTEVITYLIDMLVRKQKLDVETTAAILAAPLWDEIENMNEEDKRHYTALRSVYSSCLINGPFSILLGWNGGLMALNDRIKLRALIGARKDDTYYFASEEASVRIVCDNPDEVWQVTGGKPFIVRVDEGVEL